MAASTRRGLLGWGIYLSLALGAVVLAAHLVPLPPRLSLPSSQVITYRDGQPAHVFLSPDEKVRIAVPLEEVDPGYLTALLRLEDKRFFTHGGVDPLAVARAVWVNLRAGRVVSGGSTLTMQLVRLAEPRPRTLRSKMVEALRAVQLELLLEKREILERYLQLVPYGGNVEGLEAASWAYFGHAARRLSAEEIALLLAVPQDPNDRHPSERNARRLKAARDEIAERLAHLGALPDGEGEPRPVAQRLEELRAVPVPTHLTPFAREAPHAAYYLRQRHPDRARLISTLDRGAQRLAEDVLQAAQAELAPAGIRHGAIVVIDHRSGEVRALVGGTRFGSGAAGDQIPAFDAPRSPGSALKPFIYAMALDGGLALPEHLVSDIPVDYRGYTPRNYDGAFTGLTRMEDALSRSLNVPFVNLLKEVKVERFVGTLRQLGARHLVDHPGHYGLSAAIGAVEVTPLELAGFYAMLAHDGEGRVPRLVVDEARPLQALSLRVLSPGAAYLTRRALARRDRPDFPGRRRVSLPRDVHWKTGTSYGHRDAWAAGSGPELTAAVWLGNLDNTPSVALVGAEAAGPLLFDVLEGLARRGVPTPREAPPADLAKIEVCTYSGHLPGPACEHTTEVLGLSRSVPTTPCPYHVAVDVEVKSGLQVRPGCREGREYVTRAYLRWPASVRRFLSRAQRVLPEPPALAPGCGEAPAEKPPAILSPPAGMTALLRPDLPLDAQEIPLEAESPAGDGLLSWFVNGDFLGQAPAREPVWWQPRAGRHEILVEDGQGQSATRTLEVRLLQ
ncbi:MAG: penicillin-binding protein 1C [Deltaproteobacteria bacterium]|nr:penicillin-binding protein 1C [Deltaproteobacteria bacterium]